MEATCFINYSRPSADSLGLSFVVAALPIVVVLVLLGWARRPAWQASLAGLDHRLHHRRSPAGSFPSGSRSTPVAAGAVFALWPVMWIVFAAILLYNIAQRSGRFDAFRMWMIDNLPNDRRIVLVVIGFSFGALLEGISGFGTPIAITSSLLILLGFPPLEALTFTLIFNTAPVAFGALGVPITVLGAVTHLPTDALAKMVGRQLPFFALLLPFYVIGVYAGFRNMLRVWPVLLVSGGSVLAHAVRHVELHQLFAYRRAFVAGVADRDDRVPARVEARRRRGLRRQHRPGRPGARQDFRRPGLVCRGSSCRRS